MIIPVRVHADAQVHTVGGIRELQPDHPLYSEHCPVCDFLLGTQPITLVFVGIEPEDRKDTGWTTGGAVAVHAACAGLADEDREQTDG
ncbi:hypothetical protein [Streptomyces vilmorinianum]|uniref:hypothetical protein n=1 Tax=Streptomyces vilmorinianum TaxID=3051092 RepID=UPI0010FADF77|nr:hypothetical protein [Streptomyces vilmorinianum]